MVDEQIAKAWGKLTKQGVYESTDPLSPKSSPRTRWFIRGYMGRYVPDPVVSPWEWVKAFAVMQVSILFDFCHDGHTHVRFNGREYVEYNGDVGDAFAEAIRAWGAAT